ncbi:MAG: hypothetical protein LBP38_03185 [Desulfovibrio sp.]|nr:hypothetical protein [Desulfovibrio sp.]
MAVNALTLAACLRPWRGAGIYVLLRDACAGAPGYDMADAADAGQADLCSQAFTQGKTGAGGAESGRRPPYREAGRSYRADAPAGGGAGRVAREAYIPGSTAAPTAAGIRGAARRAGVETSGSGQDAVFAAQGAYRNAADEADAGGDSAAPAAGVREVAVNFTSASFAAGALPTAAQFSAPWRALLEKTQPAPLVWTYEELGCDLQGTPSAQRSHCLKALIAELRLPRGSSAFWPLCLPSPAAGTGTAAGADEVKNAVREGEVLSARTAGEGVDVCAEFVAGVGLLGAGAVLYFGTAAVLRSGFALTIRTPYTQQMAGGIQHILLPALSVLAEGAEQAEKAVTYLRSVLTDHPLLRARAAKGRPLYSALLSAQATQGKPD